MAVTMDWTLEIHHIDVGGGDATAIVVKDSGGNFISKVLIDAGAEGSGSQSLKSYMEKYLGNEPFDYIIASHYHNDHIDGFRQCGVTFKKYLDVGGYTIKAERFTSINGSGFTRSPGFFTGYTKLIADEKDAARVKIPFIEKGFSGTPEPLKIPLGEITGITLTCYCANGILADGTNVLEEQKKDKSRRFNPNDLSLVFILEWEGFRYFTAGDLSGDPTLKSYYNVEGELVQYLIAQGKKPITAMKVNHHGSERSNYPATGSANGFLDQLEPETLIIPCNISKNVPSPTFLERAYIYCEEKKATVVFVNDVKYYRRDKEYDEVVKLQNNSDLNCNILLDDSDKTASNDTKAIIIRRHSRGQRDDGMLEGEDVRIPRNGYAVIIKKGKIEREGGTISRPPKYEFGAPFSIDLYEAIKKGFENQADAIIKWLQMDASEGQREGIEYVSRYFPELKTVIETTSPDKLRGALAQAMTDLFDRTFQEGSIKGTYSINYAQFNDLSLEEKITLYFLLRDNKYQYVLNYATNKTLKGFKIQDAWNYTDEPYEPSSAEKRKAELEPDSLKAKEQKADT